MHELNSLKYLILVVFLWRRRKEDNHYFTLIFSKSLLRGVYINPFPRAFNMLLLVDISIDCVDVLVGCIILNYFFFCFASPFLDQTSTVSATTALAAASLGLSKLKSSMLL